MNLLPLCCSFLPPFQTMTNLVYFLSPNKSSFLGTLVIPICLSVMIKLSCVCVSKETVLDFFKVVHHLSIPPFHIRIHRPKSFSFSLTHFVVFSTHHFLYKYSFFPHKFFFSSLRRRTNVRNVSVLFHNCFTFLFLSYNVKTFRILSITMFAHKKLKEV